MAKRALTLLRHGDALAAAPGAEDYGRVLSARGEDDIRRLSQRCLHLQLHADWLYASSAARTQASAAPFERIWTCPCVDSPELYLAHEHQLLDILRQTPPDIAHVFMVGHNPGISYLASLLCHQPARIELPTAGLVSFEITAEWVDLRPQCANLTLHLQPSDY